MKFVSAGLFTLVALTSGCMSSGPEPLQLSADDSGQRVTAFVGQETDLLLQTIGPGEYGDPTVSSDAMRFLDVTFPGPANPGGPRQLFRFTAVSPGLVEIQIPHTGQANAFTLIVMVTSESAGIHP
jgi:hypothetical protein